MKPKTDEEVRDYIIGQLRWDDRWEWRLFELCIRRGLPGRQVARVLTVLLDEDTVREAYGSQGWQFYMRPDLKRYPADTSHLPRVSPDTSGGGGGTPPG